MRFLFFLVVIAIMPAYAGAQVCLSQDLLNGQLQQQPVVAADRARMETFTQNWIEENGHGTPRELAIIPVVVHVVWSTAAENISDEQIISQIEVLNKDFRKTNADSENVMYPPFRNVRADAEIEFQLATVDPFGNATTGITRTQTNIPEIGIFRVNGKRAICYEELGGHDVWCSNHYLNIWIGAFPPGIAGEASFPGQDIPEEDGVRIAPHRFGTVGTATVPYHLGRTATHEIGHYFNLYHVWGNSGNANPDCLFDDEVADTPKQTENYLNQCPTFTPPWQSSCIANTPDMFCNYMNYTDDACMVMFTQGQKLRMRATLDNSRSGLVSQSGACLPVSNQSDPIAEERMKLLPNPANQFVVIEGLSTGATIRCFGVNGALWPVYQEFENKIRVGHLPVGAYFLQIKNERNMITKMLIIARL
jgi:hypothetical protein